MLFAYNAVVQHSKQNVWIIMITVQQGGIHGEFPSMFISHSGQREFVEVQFIQMKTVQWN